MVLVIRLLQVFSLSFEASRTRFVWRAYGKFGSFLELFFIAACNVHFGSIGLQRSGDDETKSGAAWNHHGIRKCTLLL